MTISLEMAGLNTFFVNPLIINYRKKLFGEKDKKGFTNPQEQWMKTDLKEFFSDYIASDNPIYSSGLISKTALESKYQDFLSGKAWYREVFNAISLDYWLREFKLA